MKSLFDGILVLNRIGHVQSLDGEPDNHKKLVIKCAQRRFTIPWRLWRNSGFFRRSPQVGYFFRINRSPGI